MSNEIVTQNGALTIDAENVGVASAVAREQSEIQGAIISAKRYPRNEAAAFLAGVKAFERPAMAEIAEYRYPRGKTEVSGPSVYCARQLARSWGNMRYGSRVVSIDADYCHIKGYALDLESNTYIEHEDKFRTLVQRKVWTNGVSETKWVTPDERDLRELVNKRGAIASRNAILQVLPPDYVEDAIQKARETLRKVASKDLSTSRADTVKILVQNFDKLGVSVEMLEKRLGHQLSVISESELATLRQVFGSIRAGESTREEHFEFKAQEDPRDIPKSKPRTEWAYNLMLISDEAERSAVGEYLVKQKAKWSEDRQVWLSAVELKRAVKALVEATNESA